MKCYRLWVFYRVVVYLVPHQKTGKFKNMAAATGEDLFVRHNHWCFEWQMSPVVSGIYHFGPPLVVWDGHKAQLLRKQVTGVGFKINSLRPLFLPCICLWKCGLLVSSSSCHRFCLLPCIVAMMDSSFWNCKTKIFLLLAVLVMVLNLSSQKVRKPNPTWSATPYSKPMTKIE